MLKNYYIFYLSDLPSTQLKVAPHDLPLFHIGESKFPISSIYKLKISEKKY